MESKIYKNKFLTMLVLMIALSFGMVKDVGGQGAIQKDITITYSAGTEAQTFTTPQGVTQVTGHAWGGGGGGGGAYSSAAGDNAGGGGGGAAYNRKDFNTSAGGVTISISVGAGGVGGYKADGTSSADFNGTSGGATTITTSSSESIVANGGGFGSGKTGGTGSAAAGSAGTGGMYNGAAGGSGGSGSTASGRGGGAGGADGAANGITGGNGGTYNLPGGDGGASISNSDNGKPGVEPGGGGSGARNTSWGGRKSGGNGGDGRVVLTFTLPTPTILSNSAVLDICEGETITLSATTEGSPRTNGGWEFIRPGDQSGIYTDNPECVLTKASQSGTYKIRTHYTIPRYEGDDEPIWGYVDSDNSVEVIIHPKPVITNTNLTQTVCNGTSSTPITLTSSSLYDDTSLDNVTYTWVNNNPEILLGSPDIIILSTDGEGTTLPSFTVNNPGTTEVSATITVTPTYTATDGHTCTGDPVDFTITVPGIPSIALTNPEPFCAGKTINELITPVVTWNGPEGTTGWRWRDSQEEDDDFSGDTPLGVDHNNAPIYYYAKSTCGNVAESSTITLTIHGDQTISPPVMQAACTGSALSDFIQSDAVINWGGGATGTAGWSRSNQEIEEVALTETFSSSTTLYYYAKSSCGTVFSDPVTLTVNPMPVLSIASGTTFPATINCGDPYSFGITSMANCYAGTNVKAKITFLDPSFANLVDVEYLETAVSPAVYMPLTFSTNGVAYFGPDAGFPFTDDLTSSFRITNKNTATANTSIEATVTIFAVGAETTPLATLVLSSTVIAQPTLSIAGTFPATINCGDPYLFGITSMANCYAGTNVKAKITFLDPSFANLVDVEYLETAVSPSVYMPLTFSTDGVAYFGPDAGFPFTDDLTSSFRITNKNTATANTDIEATVTIFAVGAETTPLATLVLSSTVIAQPTLSIAGTFPATINCGDPYLFGITSMANCYAGTNVKAKITFLDPSFANLVDVEYLETAVSPAVYMPLTFSTDGVAYFGPDAGFPFTDDLTSSFRITNKNTATANTDIEATVTIFAVGAETTPLATLVLSSTVIAQPTLSIAGTFPATINCGDPYLFGITSMANCYAGTNVKAKITFLDPSFANLVDVEYLETAVSPSVYMPLTFSTNGVAYFGPDAGFPFTDDLTSSFRITNKNTATANTDIEATVTIFAVGAETTPLATLVLSSTVIAQPTLSIAGTFPATINCGDPYLFGITSMANCYAGTNVKAKITFLDPSFANLVDVEYLETAVSPAVYNSLTFSTDGVAYFGPDAGFPFTDDLTSSFRITNKNTATANTDIEATVTIFAVGAETTPLATLVLSSTVIAQPTLSIAGTFPATINCGDPYSFGITSMANCYAGTNVKAKITFLDPSFANLVDVEYLETAVSPAVYMPLTFSTDGVAYFGPDAGFPFTDDLTSSFRITNKNTATANTDIEATVTIFAVGAETTPLATLVLSSTVIAQPTLSIAGTFPATINCGDPYSFGITSMANCYAGTNVKAKITFLDPSFANLVDVEYLETAVSPAVYMPLTFSTDGVAYFGPDAGFPFTDDLTSSFRITNKNTATANTDIEATVTIFAVGAETTPLATLVLSSTVIAQPTLSIAGTFPATINCGDPYSFGITSMANCYAGTNVKAKITFLDPSFANLVDVEYLETAVSPAVYMPLTFSTDGVAYFGPDAGFPFTDDLTSSFRITNKNTATANTDIEATVTIFAVGAETTPLATLVLSSTVIAQPTLSIAGTFPATINCGDPYLFGITSMANCYAGTNVKAKITFLDPSFANLVDVEYLETAVSPAVYNSLTFSTDGVAYFGPDAGFPFTDDLTSSFRITNKNTATANTSIEATVTIFAVGAETTPLATLVLSSTVTPIPNVTVELTSEAEVCSGDLVSFEVTPVNGANSLAYTLYANGTELESGTLAPTEGQEPPYTVTARPIVTERTEYTIVFTEVKNTVTGCINTAPTQYEGSITVNPIPVAPSITMNPVNGIICETGTVTLTATEVADAIYTWYLEGEEVEGETGNTLTVDEAGAGSYTVTVTLNDCTSEESEPADVIVNDIPETPSITMNPATGIIYGTGTVTLTATEVVNGIYTWYLGDNVVAGETTNILVVDQDHSGIYKVSVAVDGCSSEKSESVEVILEMSVCIDGTTTLTAPDGCVAENTTGTISPTAVAQTASTDFSRGDKAWTLGVAAGEHTIRLCESLSGGEESNALQLTGFNFDVLNNLSSDEVEITGISISFERKRNTGLLTVGTIQDHSIGLLLNGDKLGNPNTSGRGTNWPGTYATKTYGDATTTWGATLTKEVITNSAFGLYFVAEAKASGVGLVCAESAVRNFTMTVYYKTGGQWYTAESGGELVYTGNEVIFDADGGSTQSAWTSTATPGVKSLYLQCGDERTEMSVNVIDNQSVEWEATELLFADGDPEKINLTYEGFTPWSFTYSVNGGTDILVEDIEETTYSIDLSGYEIGDYVFELTNLNEGMCVTLPDPIALTIVDEVLPTDIEILNCPDRGILYVNNTYQMEAQISPHNVSNKTILWRSSNPNVAVVDANGLVTCRNVFGLTYIIAATADGSFADTCSIMVIIPPTSIVLNKSELTMSVSTTERLSATVFPINATHKEVTWESSDETIATVDQNGYVTAIALGNVTITATAVYGDNLYAECAVSVVESEIPATGIAITPKTLIIDEGETADLTVTLKPINATSSVTWTSNNPAVATVDSNGTVTAILGGKATITAQTSTGYKATCTVTVTVPIDEIIVTPDECTLPFRTAKVLKATVYPTNATNKTITWSSSNTALATVSATGIVTAKSTNGVVEIYATNVASGKKGICVVTIGTGDPAVPIMSITEENELSNIELFPNPVTSVLTVKFNGNAVQDLEIYNLQGQRISSQSVKGKDQVELNVESLPTGIYFIRADQQTLKFVKR